ncbi:hypothetical protein ACSS6W_008282 [Trichoderma asperelloides]
MDSPTTCYDVLILGDGPAARDPIAIAAWLLSIVSLAHDGESPEQFRAGAREQLRQKYPNIVMAEGEMIVQARQVDFSYQGRNLKGFRLQSEGVVILTNGDIPEYEQEAVDKALRLARGVGCTVENRRISQLRLSDATESSLVTLVEELGLELEDTPHLGTTIKRREPCGETNIPGLYVTGDAGTHAKQIVIAMAQGGYAADSLWGELLTEDAEWRIKEAGGGAGV